MTIFQMLEKARNIKASGKAFYLMATKLIHDFRNKKTKQRDGCGVQLWPDGSKYEGMWRNDKACGKGRMTHANGDIYEGNFEKGKRHGYGVYSAHDHTVYEGEWF